MYLARLDIHDVRNIASAQLRFPPGPTLLVGDNGSGKTSVLEAVWLLGTGRSFRSNRVAPMIRYGAQAATVFGEVVVAGGHSTSIGVTRERSGGMEIKVGGEAARASSALAAVLPVQLINPDSVELVIGPPARRRRFLDWGTFHVEPSFLATWKSFRRGLEQRNALLRRSVSAAPHEFDAWEARLGEDAERLNGLRSQHVDALQPVVADVLRELGGPDEIEIRYTAGWDRTQGALSDLLASQRDADREQGYTRAGPQRADLRLTVGGRSAAEVLSRGQQKILACALLLAQGRRLASATAKQGIYLVDDLPAELDREHRELLGRALATMPAQVLVTAVQHDLVISGLQTATELMMFHVEQGRVSAA